MERLRGRLLRSVGRYGINGITRLREASEILRRKHDCGVGRIAGYRNGAADDCGVRRILCVPQNELAGSVQILARESTGYVCRQRGRKRYIAGAVRGAAQLRNGEIELL